MMEVTPWHGVNFFIFSGAGMASELERENEMELPKLDFNGDIMNDIVRSVSGEQDKAIVQ